MDARRVLWVGAVIGFLALAVAGPVAMIRERRPAQRAAAAPAPAAPAKPSAATPAPSEAGLSWLALVTGVLGAFAGGFGISAFVRGRPRHG